LFSLTKTGDVWTLHYEVGVLRHVLLVGAGLAGVGFAIIESSPKTRMIALLPVIPCLALMGYSIASDAPTTATFDIGRRQIRVESRRPWFGRALLLAFSEVAALYAVKRSGESTDSWEAVLANGRRIRLGSEAEGRNERVRLYLEEIRKATGIAGH
jgi:hypothetical protein